MTHAHKELIEQWLDDPTIDFERVCSSDVYLINVEPVLDDRQGVYKFRIKPTPKPDVVIDYKIELSDTQDCQGKRLNLWAASCCDNVRFIFDGETGKLKSVDML